jgi:Spy/CpxP family protein refolding chaperone
MKRLICAALAATLLVPGMLAVSARAQDDGPDAQEQDGPKHHDMADKIKEHLGLSDDQAAKFKDAMKAHMDAMKPLGEKLKAGMKSLHEQVKAKAADADIKATLDSLKANRQAMAAEQEKFHESLAAFLTPTQQAKMVLGMAQRMRQGGPGGRGGWRGRGGRGGDKPSPKDQEDDHDDDKGE